MTKRNKQISNSKKYNLICGIGIKKIDQNIVNEVNILWNNGINITESCQGGQGHPYPEPTIRFSGGINEGLKAVSIAIEFGLKIINLKRVWSIIDGEIVGPEWEIVF